MHPVLFHSPWFTIYTYGFFVAAATLSAFFIAMNKAESAGLAKNTVADLIFFLFIAGILGARAFYVFQHFEDYKGRLVHAFSIQEGGLVWYGGFIAAVLFGLCYAKFKRLPLLKLCDFFSPIAALSHGIGRIGCFFNGCCYGRPAEPPLGVFFEGESAARIPTQAYEAAFLFLLSSVLFRAIKGTHKDGEIFLNYILMYSVFRFAVEFFRGDQAHIILLTIPQWISVFFILAAFFLRQMLQKRNGKN